MAGRVSGTEAVNVHLDTAANGAKQQFVFYHVYIEDIVFHLTFVHAHLITRDPDVKNLSAIPRVRIMESVKGLTYATVNMASRDLVVKNQTYVHLSERHVLGRRQQVVQP